MKAGRPLIYRRMALKIGVNDPCPCGSGKKYKKCCLKSKVTKYEPILLLFGAGASLGSGGMTSPPPSGTRLFGELCEIYPDTWGKISGQFADNFKSLTFEGGMLALYEPPQPYNVNNLLNDMGMYFARFKIDDIKDNLYYQLFNRYRTRILEGKIVLSTLNYDCLIEYALFGSNITSIAYYGDDNGAKLLKLHGSCNFIPRGFTVARTNDAKVILGSSNLNLGMDIVHPEKAEEELSKAGIVPAMSLYARGKKNISCEQQILTMQSKFQEITQSAKAIFSIGIRPNADDHHIWDYIIKSQAKITLIAGKEDCQNWITKYPNWKYLGEKFGLSFNELCNKIDNRLG